MNFDGMELHELGHDMWFSWVQNGDGLRIGVIEWHVCPNQQGGGLIDLPDGRKLSGGMLMFDIIQNANEQRPKWQLRTMEPLHLDPSVLCRTCGLHGWIHEGRWVPA